MSASRHSSSPSLRLRVLTAGVCVPFWISGIDKLLDLNGASREMLDIGMSHPDLVALTVVLVQLGGSMLAVFGRGAVAATGALALAVFTVAATWLAHAFWTFHGQQRFGEMNIFFEHVSIVCGLALAAWAHARSSLPSAFLHHKEGSQVDAPATKSSAGNEAVY